MQPFDDFARSIPRKLVPARRCECGMRVPEEEAVWHREEYRQMEEAFFDAVDHEYGRVLGTSAGHLIEEVLASLYRTATDQGWEPSEEPLWRFMTRAMEDMGR